MPNESTLWQFQCQREGSIFYYQHGMRPSHLVGFCPVCGSKRVELTGRTFDALDETKTADAELISTQETTRARRLVERAARAKFPRRRRTIVFEHGQWWVIVRDYTPDEDRRFSVIDAEPSVADTGLEFEEI